VNLGRAHVPSTPSCSSSPPSDHEDARRRPAKTPGEEASHSLTLPWPLVDYVGERIEFWLHLDDNGMITEVEEMLDTATAPDTAQ